MPSGFTTVAYIVGAILFILSLGGLSTQQTARRGNVWGMVGMAVAVCVTILGHDGKFTVLMGAMALGALLGAILAARVAMTSMPELVALLHSLVGLAAVLVGFGSALSVPQTVGAERIIHELEVYVGVFVGAITFTGSLVAFGKLRGLVRSRPVLLPLRHALNGVVVLACVALGVRFVGAPPEQALVALAIQALLAGLLSIHVVMAIGGADMPVVVSMLNSYSGWAASAAGFMLSNDLLIITGALVGSSGAILSYIMCRAMNRSFLSVILGGFGGAPRQPAAPATTGSAGQARELTVLDVAQLVRQSQSVIIVPGYGMAVAQAQRSVYELSRWLQQENKSVRYAIHPVAGRLPGHMNVLLAEARVPYPMVLEMEAINPDFPQTDLVLVIGANDIVNPGAVDDPQSPLYGMPVLEVWKARTTVVIKRSLGSGYAGVDNPLFFRDNTRMLLGDAQTNIQAVVDALHGVERMQRVA